MVAARRKQILKAGWKMAILIALKKIFMKKTCCLLSLRVGTVLIALTELLITSFFMFLIILGITHSQEMIYMVSSTMEELEATDVRLQNVHEAFFYFNNEERLLKGQQLASVFMNILLSGLVISTIHVIACIMLLVGAMRRIRFLMLPWASIVLFTMIAALIFLVMFLFFPMEFINKLCISSTIGVFTVYEMYTWVIVVNFYRELKT